MKPAKRIRKPKFKVGQVVAWRGQVGQCYGLIVRMTEPQVGNFVVWMDIGNGNKPENQFPMNQLEVRSLTSRELGTQ